MDMRESGATEERCPVCDGLIYALSGRSTYSETRTKDATKVVTSHETKAECSNGHEWIIDAGQEEIENPPVTALSR